MCDHNVLRHDMVMQTAVGRAEPLGSAPTLSRLETGATPAHSAAVHEVLMQQFIASHARAPKELVLDVDSWMFRIMQNAWIDEVRARERRGQTFLPEAEGEQVGDGSATGSQMDAILVRKAVARLSDEHRAVVGLVLIEGLSYHEAAETLGVPVGTVTSRVARAREALQNLLGEWP